MTLITLTFTLIVALAEAKVKLSRTGGEAKIISASYDSANEVNPEEKVRNGMEQWLAHVEREGIDDDCHGVVHQEVQFNSSLALVAPADCSEEDTVQDFWFSGQRNSRGIPEGHGVLKINKTQDVVGAKACLRLNKIFSTEIEEMEGTFSDGFLNGKIKVRWAEEGLEVEALVKESILHGNYKVTAASVNEDQEPEVVWTHGMMINGVLSKNHTCWVVTEHQVRIGQCEDAFVFYEDTPVLVINRLHQRGMYPGSRSISVKGILKGEQLFNATDATLTEIKGWANCTRMVAATTQRATFNYDLSSGERRFKLYKIDRVCGKATQGQDQSAKALRKYFSKLQLHKVMGFQLDASPLDKKKAKKFIANIEWLDENRFEAVVNFFSSQLIEFRYIGDKNDDEQFEGYAVLQVSNKMTCFRGQCSMPHFSRISGHFVSGVLEGPASLVTPDGLTFGFVVSEGVIHSLVSSSGVSMLYPYPAGNSGYSKVGNRFDFASVQPGVVARFINGRPEGKIWRGLIGDASQPAGAGYLYGSPSTKSMNITGDDVAYLYPWYELGLSGRFEENVMKEARLAQVISTRCQDGFMDVDLQVDPQQADITYDFDPATNDTISSRPTLQDPLEALTVEVKPSTLPNAGEGLFAKRDIAEGQLVALYSGVVFSQDEYKIHHEKVCLDIMNSDNPCDKYSITTHKMGTIIIPSPYNDISHYKATLAWKLNNNYGPEAQVYFHDIEHPRFGLIVAVTAQKPIKQGDEIFVDYLYIKSDAPGSQNHRWYFEQKEDYLKKRSQLSSSTPAPKTEL